MPSLVELPAECFPPALAQQAINDLLPQVFGPGGGRRGKAQGYSNAIDKARRDGNTQLAYAYVDTLINYTLQNYYAGNLIGGQSTATQDRVRRFIYLLYCANSITPIPDLSNIFGAENTVLIRNSTPTTVVNDGLNKAAVKVDQGDVPSTVGDQPFFGTLVSVFKTTTALPTSLDWYGLDGYKAGAFEFVTNPEVTFIDPVLAGVCISYDDQIVTSPSDLRLAHEVEPGYTPVIPGNYVVTTSVGTIEIGAPVSTSPLGLSCDPLLAGGGMLERALQHFASLFLPGPVFAAIKGGGTGGQVVKFSPFAAVDQVLELSGSAPLSAYIEAPATSTTVTATASVETRHPDGLAIQGVRVDFAPTASFDPSFDFTDANGSASSGWTLVSGSNSGSATPSLASLIFSPASVGYSATATVISDISIGTTSPLPDGKKNQFYSQTFVATGGDGTNYEWEKTAGTLPAGVTLASTGVLSGTPTQTGTFSFTATVTSGPKTASRTYSLTIALPNITSLTLAFAQQPGKSVCSTPIAGPPSVSVRDQEGNLRPGIAVSLAAVDNNGTPAQLLPVTPATSNASGIAIFSGYRLTKTGGYRLVASTTAPTATVRSDKFNVSPPCP